MCSGVVWRRFFGAAAWPFRPKTPYAIPNLQQTDNWPRTHEDRLVRHVTAAAESEPDVLGWEHERETRAGPGRPGRTRTFRVGMGESKIE